MVSIRTRLCLALLVIVGAGFAAVVYWIVDDLRPRFFATMEESMVDMSVVLAAMVENDLAGETLQTEGLREAFETAHRKHFEAVIYEAVKSDVNLRVYVTDAAGTVVFDSRDGVAVGKDYSQWNDVLKTLRGEYGARATRNDPDDPLTEVLYVAAPIHHAGEIAGVLTVSKPAGSITQFLRAARTQVAVAGAIAALAVLALGFAVSIWITRPLGLLTAHARAVRDGKRVTMPRLVGGEVRELGAAFEEMRTALEGRDYVEQYVQTLTHQMKSPLAALRGAAELLEEDMPPADRARFVGNIKAESARMHDLVDRMLSLASLEKRTELREVERIDLKALIVRVVETMHPVFVGKALDVAVDAAERVTVSGERFLIEQALTNLLQNAVDFSPESGTIRVLLREEGTCAILRVIDDGPGVPDYAGGQVFDRFYSLPRPEGGRKSTGLGLTFVREAAALHGGDASLRNLPEGGVEATLSLPHAR
jgi:two-component system sensor histidine kinase CreC